MNSRQWVSMARRCVVAALTCAAIGGCDRPTSPDDAVTGCCPTITGAEVRARIEILAADDMEGREAGSAGHRRAADYVASQFARFGLVPLGDDGTFLQAVPLLETRLVPGTESLTLRRDDAVIELERGEDFVRAGGFGDVTESITAPLLFAGYGVTAPEYDHDDYAGIDPAGRILVVFSGAPPRFGTDERAYYSSTTGKQRRAAELGASGLLTIRTPADRERMTWPRMRAAAESSAMRWRENDGRPHEGFAELAGNAMLSDSGASRLFELAGHDLDVLFDKHDRGETGSFALSVSATLARQSTRRETASPNVVALLRGSDAQLRNEYVVVTAHLDHLGNVTGDGEVTIYHGAYDNAAGIATVLEVANALATGPTRRSIIFAAVTAEEKGLRGSDYLAAHAPVPIDAIVANINVDMPFLGFPVADVEGFGAEHSTLGETLRHVAAQHGMALTPDPRPELVRMIRSDQFSFVQRGVPGLNVQPGNASSDPAVDGTALRASFLRDHYHQASDDLDLPFSHEGAARFATLILAFTAAVANADERPRWHDGDFFGERFANKRGRTD